jgi:ABC-type cobalt transport system substrate-binding protein
MRFEIADLIIAVIRTLKSVIPASESASGIPLQYQRDSGQAGMTTLSIRLFNHGNRLRIDDCKFKISHCAIVTVCLFVLMSLFAPASFADEKWQGIDDAVVKKVAKEHGREAWEPFINTDQGDLLLFVFLIAGTIGGFAAGYYWRVLIENKNKNTNNIIDDAQLSFPENEECRGILPKKDSGRAGMTNE